MTITNLYNIEKRLDGFSNALEYASNLNALTIGVAMELDRDRDIFGIGSDFSQNFINPILEIISTQEGLDAAKQKYEEVVSDLPNFVQVAVMAVLYRAPEKLRRNALDMNVHCLRSSSLDAQEDFLITEPFDCSKTESNTLNPNEAKALIAACDREPQDTIINASAQEALRNLALYAYDVRVSPTNTTMAIMKQPNEAVIPFGDIENDLIRAYCQEHEQDIHGYVHMLDPDLSAEFLDKLEKIYAESGIPFDRENESKSRSQEFRESIAGLTRDDYWTLFEQHAFAMQIVLEHQVENSPDNHDKLNHE